MLMAAGDFVDRGAWGLETFLLLACWKLTLPAHVTLLRGNHETTTCTYMYGFRGEIFGKYGKADAKVGPACPTPDAFSSWCKNSQASMHLSLQTIQDFQIRCSNSKHLISTCTKHKDESRLSNASPEGISRLAPVVSLAVGESLVSVLSTKPHLTSAKINQAFLHTQQTGHLFCQARVLRPALLLLPQVWTPYDFGQHS